jgi:isoleucyl-tRNA synthetase
MAYRTLHYVLVRLAYVLAPFTPFLAEELYRNLTGDKQSIHLKDWMPAGRVNELVMNDMETVRDYVNQGLSLRAKAGIKVRQPLASISVPKLGEFVDFEAILTDELNVKQVIVSEEVVLDENITPELHREGLMRETVRAVQVSRKAAKLEVDDRIVLALVASHAALKHAVDEYGETISQETLAVSLADTLAEPLYRATHTIEGMELEVMLQKA